jgi:hypothetical protein
MDIYCPKCAEPIELEYLHDIADDDGSTFTEVLHAFQSDGCEAVHAKCNLRATDRDRARASGAALMYELLGDDIDGAAAMLEDLEHMGVW